MGHMSQDEFIEEFKEILVLTLTSTALFDTCPSIGCRDGLDLPQL